MVELPNRPLLTGSPYIRPDEGASGNVVSDVSPVIPLQDAVNLLWAQMFTASDFAALPQRYVIGAERPTVPVYDDAGRKVGEQEVDLSEFMTRRLFWVEGDAASAGSWPAANLAVYTDVIETAIGHIAAQTRTPQHYLIGKMANLPLALDTVVPVPGGRTTMGALSPGDEVYASDGTIQKVAAVSPVFRGHRCYRMTFDDGTQVTADANHKWETTHFADPEHPYGRPVLDQCPECGFTPQPGKDAARSVGRHRVTNHGITRRRRVAQRETSVVTTEQVAATLRTSMGTFNHFIPVAAPHDGPDADFDIDPYVLGVFLGDGDRLHGLITSHKDDAEEMAGHLRACGESVDIRPYAAGDEIHEDCRLLCIRHDRTRCPYGHKRPAGTKKDSARCRTCDRVRHQLKSADLPDTRPKINRSFAARLADLGVRGNKHIPEQYFHGSFKQRLALVQGLMDTDGTVKRGQGSVLISLHDERLARDLHRLVQSLGHKAALTEQPWKHKKFGTGLCWAMPWMPPDPVFRLARKAALQRLASGGGDGKSSSPFRRYITACDETESVPVRCINVSSDTHLFCVTDAFLVTHNSSDALIAAEAGLVKRVQEKQLWYGQALREVQRLVALAQGNEQKAAAYRAGKVLWMDVESRSQAVLTAALAALKGIGWPFQDLARRYGLTPEEVAQLMAMREHEAIEDPVLAMLGTREPMRGTAGEPAFSSPRSSSQPGPPQPGPPPPKARGATAPPPLPVPPEGPAPPGTAILR
jgi:replicative DNA helicase